MHEHMLVEKGKLLKQKDVALTYSKHFGSY